MAAIMAVAVHFIVGLFALRNATGLVSCWPLPIHLGNVFADTIPWFGLRFWFRDWFIWRWCRCHCRRGCWSRSHTNLLIAFSRLFGGAFFAPKLGELLHNSLPILCATTARLGTICPDAPPELAVLWRTCVAMIFTRRGLPLTPFGILSVADSPLCIVVYVRRSCCAHAVSCFHLPHVLHAGYYRSPRAVCFVSAWSIFPCNIHRLHAVAVVIMSAWFPHRTRAWVSYGVVLAVQACAWGRGSSSSISCRIRLTIFVSLANEHTLHSRISNQRQQEHPHVG